MNCYKCKTEKSTEDFYKNEKACKTCVDKRNREWREANPEKVAEVQRNWRSKNEGRTYLDESSGYRNYIGYQHPAANPSGLTREHRIVLWDKLNGQNANCNWCEKPLVWGVDLVADHLNWDRADNRPENLVPSCQPCNAKRRNPALAQGPCDGPECTKQAVSRGLCRTHYMMEWSGRELKPVQKRASTAAAELIVKDIKAGWGIESVAKKYNFNPSSVTRLFKRVTGMSIMEWRRQYKVGVAA